MEKTGIDALELNFYSTPGNFESTSAELEEQQLSVLKEVKKKTKVPVSVKLSPFYSNPLSLIKKMDAAGADGFVLFNRMFQPDIDVDKKSTTSHSTSASLPTTGCH